LPPSDLKPLKHLPLDPLSASSIKMTPRRHQIGKKEIERTKETRQNRKKDI
jgi:hypothetical protein